MGVNVCCKRQEYQAPESTYLFSKREETTEPITTITKLTAKSSVNSFPTNHSSKFVSNLGRVTKPNRKRSQMIPINNYPNNALQRTKTNGGYNNNNMKTYDLLPMQKCKSTTWTVCSQKTNDFFNKLTNNIEKQSAYKTYNKKDHSSSCDSLFSSPSISSKRKKPIEIIKDPLDKKQAELLIEILRKEELIMKDMEKDTIDSIIQCVVYQKIKEDVVIFSNKNIIQNDLSYYYILIKGKVEYEIDEEIYQLPKLAGIGTQALLSNCKESCSLYTKTRATLFALPIESYKKIAQNFIESESKRKVDCLSHCYLFKGLERNVLEEIAEVMEKETLKKNRTIIERDKVCHNMFIIFSGEVLCNRDSKVIKIFKKNDVFNDIVIFHEVESFYSFFGKEKTVLYSINKDKLIQILGENIKTMIVYYIFKEGIKNNKHFDYLIKSTKQIESMFKIFHLKYYFNENIMTKSDKKIILPISGIIIKEYTNEDIASILNSGLSLNLVQNGIINIKSILNDVLPSNYYGDECVVFECSWNEIEKMLDNSSHLSLQSRKEMIQKQSVFQNFSPFNIFLLSQELSFKEFKEGKIILENGPISDVFYIIEHGTVEINSNSSVKYLSKGDSFGDISMYPSYYSQKANYKAVTKVQCFCIRKEIYEELVSQDSSCFLSKINFGQFTKDFTISIDKLYFVKELGHGAYGKVYLTHNRKHFYALKTAEIQAMTKKQQMAEIYINEKRILYSIGHPFVVSLINTFKTKDYLFFLFEFIDGITLRKYINDPKRPLNQKNEIMFLCASLSCVLAYLQSKKIIHRDLKPDNLMINEKGYIKVIDFGIAKDLSKKQYTNTIIGTTQYMAPEVIMGKNYSYAVDFWSLGVILYETFYGKVPFGHRYKDQESIYKSILEHKLRLDKEKEHSEINHLLQGLLEKDPNKRICSFSQIQQEKLFEGFDFEKLIKKEKETPFPSLGRNNREMLLNIDIPLGNMIKDGSWYSFNENLDIENNSDEFFANF